MKRLLDHDPETGITQYHYYDPQTRKTTIETVQDVEPYLEGNVILQNDPEYSKDGIKKEFWHVARIPINVQYAWLKEGIDILNKDHWPKVKQKLMDPEWKKLRTSLGRI